MPVKTLKTRMLMKMKTLKARIYYPTILFFIVFSNIQPSDRNALLWIAVILLSVLDCKLCQGN